MLQTAKLVRVKQCRAACSGLAPTHAAIVTLLQIAERARGSSLVNPLFTGGLQVALAPFAGGGLPAQDASDVHR